MQELASVLLVFQQGQGERHGFNNGEGSKWRRHVHPVPCCPQPFFQRLGISKHGQATFTHRTQAEPRKNVLSTSLANPEQVIMIIIGERNVKMNIVLFGGR